jgi:hypothetical protein
MDGVLLGIWQWRGSQHVGNFSVEDFLVLRGVNPAAMEAAIVVVSQAGNVNPRRGPVPFNLGWLHQPERWLCVLFHVSSFLLGG